MVRVNVIQVKQADVCLNNANNGYVKNNNVTKGEAAARASQGYGTIMGAGKTNGVNNAQGPSVGVMGNGKNNAGNGVGYGQLMPVENVRFNGVGIGGVGNPTSAIGSSGDEAGGSSGVGHGLGNGARSGVGSAMGNVMSTGLGRVLSTGMGNVKDGASRNGNCVANGLPARRHSRRLASTRGLARRPAPQPPTSSPAPNGAGTSLPPVATTPTRIKSPAPQPPWQDSSSSSPAPTVSSPALASPVASPSPAASPLSASPSPSSAPSSLSAAGASASLGGVGGGGPQLCGWVRVFTGTEAEAAAAEAGGERGTLVYLTAASTVRDVCRDLLLADDLTVWVQYGGGAARRLRADEAPLQVQDAFLRSLGVRSAARRARLGVDPELRHLLRFRAGPGPAAPPLDAGPLGDAAAGALAPWGGWNRAAHLQLLKGLVFPQWRRRPVALLGTKLYLYPGSPGAGGPEELELSGGGVSERAPRHGRLVLRVTPGSPASASTSSTSTGGQRHVFLGFQQPWERDLWRRWLDEAVQLPSCPERLDLSEGGLQRLPESLTSFSSVRELSLARNRLGGVPLDGTNATYNDSTFAGDDGDGGVCCDLSALARLPLLRALSLAGNTLRSAPPALLRLAGLHSLDLSDNAIQQLPADIDRLANLVELRVERNLLREFPSALSRLRRLRTLHAAHNRLTAPPQRLHEMRALTLLDLQGNRVESGRLHAGGDGDSTAGALSRVNLRANHLKGCIVLGNYGNLTQLDVSENCIESLDLSALTKLETVQCSRNRLTELSLHGKALVSLIAGNNRLQKLTITPAPTNLKHLDVSYNELESLPGWLSACAQLRVLFASHNLLRSLPEHLLRGDAAPSLHTLQLSYNQLSALPSPSPAASQGRIPPLPLQELFLQSNSIAMLPHGFLRAATRLRVLNLSNNRLCELPPGPEPSESSSHQLEKLYLTANCLTDSALHVVATFANLRTLHAAYNCITTLPESCVAMWKDLEELVLSGNKLQYLPDNLTRLEHLRVLRVHSNRLQASPCFAKMTSLKVLDLAHNQLDRINLTTLVPQQLQFLDLSCNSRLYVDPRQFQVYSRTHRPMSLVDVSGQNRTCLPSTPFHDEGGDVEPPWKVGFSETAGLRERLYITQIRLPSFCNTEGLFGLFDGGNNNEIPNILIKAVPRILLEERTVKETADDYMKYTMLSAHRELKEKGQKYGVCATLCHLARPRPSASNGGGCTNGEGFFSGGSSGRYVLRVASVGEAGAVLCRRSEGVRLCPPDDRAPPPQTKNQLGCSAMFPLVIPDPRVTEILLEEEDEFLIIANKRFWDVVSMEEAVEEARHMGNAILAAKKLQDLAQSYGSEENLSIMVIRFSNTGSDMDQLMRELRHTIRRGKQQQNQLATDDSSQESGGRPKCYCQGIANGADMFYNNGLPPVPPHFKPGVGRLPQEPRQNPSRNGIIPDADRSSPSGQSDQASSDYTIKKFSVSSRRPSVQNPPMWGETNGTKTTMFVKTGNSISSGRPPQHQSVLMHENGTKKITPGVQGLERRSYRDSKRSGGGVLKAIRAKLDSYSNGHLADTEGEETGSDRSAGTQPSDEQFKCWEYMLEQNTQMLFDKELDTLSRSGLVRPTRDPLPDPLWPRGGKILSRSSPHLAENSNSTAAPFLSRHFGSARSFNPVSRSTRFGSGRFLNGGPNAAYFGSLQRLMPYNLEYNFAVIQERAANQDSLEQDGRMQQYWGVATTEL